MVEINGISNSDDGGNGDLGNNNRGIVVGVNRVPSFFARNLANPSFSLTKVLSKFALRYSFATIRFLKWKVNKLKLKTEEKNATVQYNKWRIPRVKDDLQNARRSLQDEKQSNEEKDGHILLVTDQKKMQIQTMKRLKRETNAARRRTEANAAKAEAEKAEAETCIGTLQGEVTTLQNRVKIFDDEMKLKAEAETRVATLQGEVTTLQKHVKIFDDEMKLKAEAETRVTSLETEVETLKQEV
jgi:septum formation topological specificity factor MinE